MSIRKNSVEHHLDDSRTGDLSSAERTAEDQSATREISTGEAEEDFVDEGDDELTEDDFEGEEEEEEDDEA